MASTVAGTPAWHLYVPKLFTVLRLGYGAGGGGRPGCAQRRWRDLKVRGNRMRVRPFRAQHDG